MKDDQPSRTAEAVAFWRALEQNQPPTLRVLDDPYAASFLSRPVRRFLALQRRPDAISFVEQTLGAGTMAFTLLRHRWMEEAMARAKGPWDQVLVLGAGYDMRAFRLAPLMGNARVFEIDHPATGQRKARVLARTENKDHVERILVDFSREDLRHALERAGFRPGLRSWFFWEGVSMYLPREAVETTLLSLREYGCEGVLDFFSPPSDERGTRGAWMRFLPSIVGMIGEPVDFLLAPKDVEEFLHPLGYSVLEKVIAADLEAAAPRPLRSHPSGWIVRIAPTDSGHPRKRP